MVQGQLGGCESLQQDTQTVQLLPARCRGWMEAGVEETASGVYSLEELGEGFGSEELIDEKAVELSKGQAEPDPVRHCKEFEWFQDIQGATEDIVTVKPGMC